MFGKKITQIYEYLILSENMVTRILEKAQYIIYILQDVLSHYLFIIIFLH